MQRLVLEQPAAGESGQILIRSRLRAVSRRMGFTEVQREQMELACTEMLTNQQKFARGSGLMQIWEWLPAPGAIDLFALDYGPGIPDLGAALTDGFTTARTLGRGLGSVGRLAHQSAIYSLTERPGAALPWHGTALWARFWCRPPPRSGFELGLFLRSYGDGPENGDLVHLQPVGNRLRWLHADGLGHGADAARAVAPLPQLLEPEQSLCTVLDRMSRALQGGRGAVAAVAEYDPMDGRVTLCGVGDIAAASLAPGGRQLAGFAPGVLGHQHRRFEALELPVTEGGLVLTASDGLRRGWDDIQLPNLYSLHPQMVVYLLGNLFGRVNDDKSVLAVRAVGG